tara:strand:- start:11579 stop:11935 length:357 start_codon:yes stop_codon:yes gene_type:complete
VKYSNGIPPSLLTSKSTIKIKGKGGRGFTEKFKNKTVDVHFSDTNYDNTVGASKLKMKISKKGRGSERFKEVMQQPDGSYMLYTMNNNGVAREKQISERRAKGFIRRMQKAQKRLQNK